MIKYYFKGFKEQKQELWGLGKENNWLQMQDIKKCLYTFIL